MKKKLRAREIISMHPEAAGGAAVKTKLSKYYVRFYVRFSGIQWTWLSGARQRNFFPNSKDFFFQGLTRCAIISFNWCRNKYLVRTKNHQQQSAEISLLIYLTLKGNPKCIGLYTMSIKYDRINRNRIEQVRCGQWCCWFHWNRWRRIVFFSDKSRQLQCEN
jgi:hypothetical protein